MRGEASGSHLAASHAAFSGAGAPAAGAWWPGSHLVGISANVMLFCCCFENNEALLFLCQNKVFWTAWTCLNFCIRGEGSGEGGRKAPRKCSNGPGPGDMFYCALAGGASLSKTEALNWALVLLCQALHPWGVSQFRNQFDASTAIAVTELKWAISAHCPWKHAAPSICWKLLLETSLWFTTQPAASSGNNLSQGLKAPLHCTVGSEAEPACICYWAKCPRKIAPYHSRENLSNMIPY